ncbi:MAG TPA: aldolase/citrate lyase family protein [Candidatus Acidoferrales bacterium]|nr:aldolase/citrate lyase family protein [Candidatus Acidoferrales bacterium]
MKRSLTAESLKDVTQRLAQAQAALAKRYPGETSRRQPVHVLYGGAHLFRADIVQRMREKAIQALDEFAPDYVTFGQALGLPRSEIIYARVREKLQREPVEDYGIDFEDGYGHRSDSEEDAHARSAAEHLAVAQNQSSLPPFVGIRIKPLSEECRERALRTLDIFLTALVEKTGGALPSNFSVTLPKISMTEEAATLVDALEMLEVKLGLPVGSVHVELMIETARAISNENGENNLLQLVSAARGRCVAVHFGPYDYTASLGVIAAYQNLQHPACDFARSAMQVALTDTGVRLADGPTMLIPIAPHRATNDGSPLTAQQADENQKAVRDAWRLHYANIRRSLAAGFYQSWDLHPAQLPARYAGVYAFFLEELDAAAERLKNFIAKAMQATRVGAVFDDAATGQGLLNYFVRAVNCGAILESEAERSTGLTSAELRSGSFLKILAGRDK